MASENHKKQNTEANTCIKVLLFDLGGVLVEFSGLEELTRLLPGNITLEEARALWIASPTNAAFERGEITTEAFACGLLEEFDLPYSNDEFVAVFKSWIKGLLPGTEELLKELRDDYTLACFSNTNKLHWDHLMEACSLAELLNKHYASHLLGMIKPNKEAFQMVCNDLGVEPKEVLFFDDGLENVQGAIAAGLEACHVNGPEATRSALKERGLL